MSWNAHLYVPPSKYESAAKFIKFGMVKLGAAPAKATLYFGTEIAKELGFAAADRVSVDIGADEHDGLLRVHKIADGHFPIKERTFKGKSSSLFVPIGEVEKFGKAKRETEIVSFTKQDDGSVVVKLPAWYDRMKSHTGAKQPVTEAQRHAQNVRNRLR